MAPGTSSATYRDAASGTVFVGTRRILVGTRTDLSTSWMSRSMIHSR